MRSLIASAAAMVLAAAGDASAQAVSAGPDTHYMVIIATPASSSATAVQMRVLTFPSERACAAAAEIFGKPVEGVNMVVRCAPLKK